MNGRILQKRLLTQPCTTPAALITAVLMALMIPSGVVYAQAGGLQPPRIVSPEVTPEREVTFRIHAPKAEAVELGGSGDIPGTGFGQSSTLTKADNGVWAITVGPLAPGAYRYGFRVDGVFVVDPRNLKTSESNEIIWSLVNVPGADWMDTKKVPHGAVSEVTYWSSTLNRSRRLHIYTPPGYESGESKYPIFYLLHGAFDSDDSWSTVGRAGFILDNLIAAGKARPMVVVMPHGHTGPFNFGSGDEPMFGKFEEEFVNDIMPQMEERYRIHTNRANRAMAGLSMGGGHTLNIGIPHLDKFGYLGIYSSGIFELAGGARDDQAQGPGFEDRYEAVLDDTQLRGGLELFWFATGESDFLVETTRATVKMFRKHGFEVVYEETDGAHTWAKWRDYLHEFVPMLFQ